MNNSRPVYIFVVISIFFAALLYGLLPSAAEGSGTGTVYINGARLKVEIVDKPAERSLGLMYRKSLPKNRGMLFIYRRPKIMNFWMKNTYIPLSIAYIDKKGYIIAIYKMEPLDTEKDYRSPGPAIWALEVNQGWFERHGVSVGDRVWLYR